MSISDSQLRTARDIAAEIVATHSKRYAPFFEILDAEIKKRETRLAEIKKLATDKRIIKRRAQRRKRRRNLSEMDAQS